MRSRPTAWKRGEWIPIFKNGDKCDVKNYRPVAVLDSVGKVFEQLTTQQIAQHYNPVL